MQAWDIRDAQSATDLAPILLVGMIIGAECSTCIVAKYKQLTCVRRMFDLHCG